MSRSPLLVKTGSERERATRLGWARIVIGSSLVLTTGFALRVFGVPVAQDNAAARALCRLFGIRNVVLGVWVLKARDYESAQRRFCYQVNTAVDAADIAALVVGGVTDGSLIRPAVMGTALGGSALVAWLDLTAEVSD